MAQLATMPQLPGVRSRDKARAGFARLLEQDAARVGWLNERAMDMEAVSLTTIELSRN
jgi:hypothetical protein